MRLMNSLTMNGLRSSRCFQTSHAGRALLSVLKQSLLRLVDFRSKVVRTTLVGMELLHEPAMRRTDILRFGSRLEA